MDGSPEGHRRNREHRGGDQAKAQRSPAAFAEASASARRSGSRPPWPRRWPVPCRGRGDRPERSVRTGPPEPARFSCRPWSRRRISSVIAASISPVAPICASPARANHRKAESGTSGMASPVPNRIRARKSTARTESRTGIAHASPPPHPGVVSGHAAAHAQGLGAAAMTVKIAHSMIVARSCWNGSGI